MCEEGNILERSAPEEDWGIFIDENHQNTLFKYFLKLSFYVESPSKQFRSWLSDKMPIEWM